MIEVNKIYFEDCYQVLQRMGAGYVDLIVQDTPFGTTRNAWDVKPDFSKMWPEWLRVGKENCPFIFFGQQPFVTELICSMPSLFRYDIIWQKTLPVGFLNASRMPLRSHEHILVFYRKLPTYNPQKTTGHPRKRATAAHKAKCKETTNYGSHGAYVTYDSTERFPTSVLTYAKDAGSQHPTKKPLELLRWIIRTYSNPGDLVFDGYVGEGTTAEASKLEGRNFICAENDPAFMPNSGQEDNRSVANTLPNEQELD